MLIQRMLFKMKLQSLYNLKVCIQYNKQASCIFQIPLTSFHCSHFSNSLYTHVPSSAPGVIIGSFRFLIHDAESSDLGKSALLRMNKEENAALGERRFRVMG